MSKSWRVVVGLVAMIGVCAAAFAGQGEGRGPRRPQQKGGLGQARIGQAPNAERCRRRFQRRMEGTRRLLNTDEGKALREQLRKDMEALHAERKTLHEKIRAEIQGGKKPQEVLPNCKDDLKALLKKGILLRLEFREKVIALARKNVDKAVDKLHGELRKRAQERRGRSGEMRRRPRPDAGAEGEGFRLRRRPPEPTDE